MSELSDRFNNLPPAVKLGAIAGLGAFAFIYIKKRGASKTTAASASTTASTGADTSAYNSQPGWGNIIGSLGSSPTGPIIGYDGSGNPIYGTDQSGLSSAPVTTPTPAPPTPVDQGSAPAPVVSAGVPQNKYNVGDTVGTMGEKIVAEVFSPVYGWLDETSMGGIYQGGGGNASINTNKYGSYLGYAATTPDPKAEIAANGDFSHGGITLLPQGGYAETNNRGNVYRFGPGSGN
jgi:hypothetical protein